MKTLDSCRRAPGGRAVKWKVYGLALAAAGCVRLGFAGEPAAEQAWLEAAGSFLSEGAGVAASARDVATQLEDRSTKTRRASLLTVAGGGEPPVLHSIELPVAPSTVLTERLPLLAEPGLKGRVKELTKNKPVAAGMWRSLHSKSLPARKIGRSELGELMEVTTLYTFILTDAGIEFLRSGENPGEAVFSKHMVLANSGPVRFAGEMWIDEFGTLHVSNASGSYKPTEEALEKAKRVFELNFELASIETHVRGKLGKTAATTKLSAPEVEAKFDIPDARAFEDLKKSLDGKIVTVANKDGQPARFQLKVWRTILIRDLFYDTPGLDLFKKNGLLRDRTRFRDAAGTSLNDRMFQAKDEGARDEGQEQAVFARNEVAGPVFRSNGSWEASLAKRLEPGASDAAVAFARNYAAAGLELSPVLQGDSLRTYIMAYAVSGNPLARVVPVFQVDVADIAFTGLTGKRGAARRYVLEAEVFTDGTPLGLAKVTDEKVYELNQLTRQLQARFKLSPSASSKYGEGVRAAVLGQPNGPGAGR